MKIGEILDRVYDEEVGWRPASGSTKPVHVANGLVRALQGGYYDIQRLHELVIWWQKSGEDPGPEHSYQAMVEDSSDDVYDGFRGSPQHFDKARKFVHGLLDADKGIFPSLDHSSYSLTTGRMVTQDSNDHHLGDFAAQLLLQGGENNSLAEIVRESVACDLPEDPITALVWPLLSKQIKPRQLKQRNKGFWKKPLHAEFLHAITDAATDLASHEVRQGNRMRTLQRVVQFACVATHAHAQALAAEGRLKDRSPALLAFVERRRSDIGLASERSAERLYRNFEQWLAMRLGMLIDKGVPLKDGEDPVPLTLDGRSIRHVMMNILEAKRPHNQPSEQTLKDRMSHFNSAKNIYKTQSPGQILGHALVDIYLQEYAASGGPRRYLQGLARRVGFLYPHFAGATTEKRFRPSVPVLDMLVRACISAGDSIPLEVLLERLWERFGLVVGGRRDDEWDDVEELASRGLPVDGPALAANTEAFVEELEAMGLAKRYPDGVTFVGDGL
jgi:hypothetical protein